MDLFQGIFDGFRGVVSSAEDLFISDDSEEDSSGDLLGQAVKQTLIGAAGSLGKSKPRGQVAESLGMTGISSGKFGSTETKSAQSYDPSSLERDWTRRLAQFGEFEAYSKKGIK